MACAPDALGGYAATMAGISEEAICNCLLAASTAWNWVTDRVGPST